MDKPNQEFCGCFLPEKIGVRTSLEAKLQEDRKKVCFSDRPNKKDCACAQSCKSASGEQNMIVTPIGHRQPDDCITVGLKGYGQPYQHLAWTTSQSVHGRYPPPPGLNPVRYPRDSSFTNSQGLGGSSSDSEFNTSIVKGYIYKPMRE